MPKIFTQKKHVLHANDAVGHSRLLPVLEGHEVASAKTLAEAEGLLNENYDLVIAGVHFDDSRAVELLRLVRQHDLHRETLFIFIKTRPSAISEQLKKTILLLQNVYHISGYVETETLSEDDEKIKAAIFACMNGRDEIRTRKA